MSLSVIPICVVKVLARINTCTSKSSSDSLDAAVDVRIARSITPPYRAMMRDTTSSARTVISMVLLVAAVNIQARQLPLALSGLPCPGPSGW